MEKSLKLSMLRRSKKLGGVSIVENRKEKQRKVKKRVEKEKEKNGKEYPSNFIPSEQSRLEVLAVLFIKPD